jgi:hypothetical protein
MRIAGAIATTKEKMQTPWGTMHRMQKWEFGQRTVTKRPNSQTSLFVAVTPEVFP